MSFWLWRVLRLKLPTNEILATFGVEPAKRSCCRNQGWDDVDHTFIQGPFSTHIWKYFASSVGINIQQCSLRNRIIQWRNNKGKNDAHRAVIRILPIVICWNLWKNRCAAKYGGKNSSIYKVKYFIQKEVLKFLFLFFLIYNGQGNGQIR